MSDRIVLGSGKLYVTTFTDKIPTDAELEVKENIIGYIQGGASLSYKPTFYEAKDDLGLVVKKIVTEEEATLTSGIMTWNGETLKKLCATARTDDKGESGQTVKTVKIGGIDNYNGESYVIRFVHKDSDGVIRITIRGTNEAGFEIAFAKDKETVINAEFKALPMDNEGTLIEYRESDN